MTQRTEAKERRAALAAWFRRSSEDAYRTAFVALYSTHDDGSPIYRTTPGLRKTEAGRCDRDLRAMGIAGVVACERDGYGPLRWRLAYGAER